jgi:hypothetical protein
VRNFFVYYRDPDYTLHTCAVQVDAAEGTLPQELLQRLTSAAVGKFAPRGVRVELQNGACRLRFLPDPRTAVDGRPPHTSATLDRFWRPKSFRK